MVRAYSLCSLLFVSVLAFAQAPAGLSYQTIVRDNAGEAITNTTISLRMSVHRTTAGGTTVFQETHSQMTNDHGLVSIVIGQGTTTIGSFNAIEWGGDSYFLEVELDPAGGSSYTTMGSSQMLSVPYALYAKEAGPTDKIADADGNTQVQTEESANENTIRFDVNGNEAMVINPSGNIGIGESSPGEQLEIRNDANTLTDNDLVLKNRHSTAPGTGSRLVFQGYRDANQDHEVASIEAVHETGDLGSTVHGGSLVFKTNTGDSPYNQEGFERMRIDEDGNVGIGTSSPSTDLHIQGSLRIEDGTQGEGYVLVSDAAGNATWAKSVDLPIPTMAVPIAYQGDTLFVHATDSGTDISQFAADGACTALATDGFNDWYLPTLSELNAMYKQSYLLTGLEEGADWKYWSSTLSGTSDAYTRRLDYGAPDPDDMSVAIGHKVRCIRKNP